MRISITGKNLEISSYMREVAEKKLAKLDRYFPQDTEAQVTLSVEKSRHIVEVTIPHGGRLIRAEEISTDMYASLDNVLDKLEKQIFHTRTRLEKSLRQDAFDDLHFDEEDEDEAPRIVRYKQFSFKPMSEEEAMLQLDLLGHAFYVFENADTGDVNVLYKRKDGNFGLIEPAK